MPFAIAKKRLTAALKDGTYVHEQRDVMAEKNLLAIGEVDAEFVIKLLNRSRGSHHTESPHDADRDVVVHTFRPEHAGKRWYIKAYFLEAHGNEATFISVHEAR
jgi:cobalamin biosynthesis protein CbiG